MSTKQNVEYTNKQVREQAAKGRGRVIVVKLDKAAKKLLERRA